YVHFSQQRAATPIAAAGVTAQPPETVPQSTTDVPSGAATPASDPAPSNAARYIQVSSDVLDIKIDRQGGDIVYAALPKFTAKLETPDQPFVLLEQDAARSYVAQSGLIGLDSNNARPL